MILKKKKKNKQRIFIIIHPCDFLLCCVPSGTEFGLLIQHCLMKRVDLFPEKLFLFSYSTFDNVQRVNNSREDPPLSELCRTVI